MRFCHIERSTAIIPTEGVGLSLFLTREKYFSLKYYYIASALLKQYKLAWNPVLKVLLMSSAPIDKTQINFSLVSLLLLLDPL